MPEEETGKPHGCESGRPPGFPCTILDAHCHLGFLEDAAAFAREGEKSATAFLSMGVDPRGYETDRSALRARPNVRVGAGLHPRWIADGRCGTREVDLLCSIIGRCRLVGEVGLDFAAACAPARDAQVSAFGRIASTCARQAPRVLSIHSLRSAETCLDILEKSGACESCLCIFHWYSDSCDQLHRAIGLGCLFSVNRRMLESKRGREYARIIPADRLLLETDLPSAPGGAANAPSVASDLQAALEGMERLRGRDCADRIAETSRMVFAAC